MPNLEHTEQNPQIEDNIRRIRVHLDYGLSRDEAHDELVPKDMSEEEFFLCYLAAVFLHTDQALHYVPGED